MFSKRCFLWLTALRPDDALMDHVWNEVRHILIVLTNELDDFSHWLHVPPCRGTAKHGRLVERGHEVIACLCTSDLVFVVTLSNFVLDL